VPASVAHGDLDKCRTLPRVHTSKRKPLTSIEYPSESVSKDAKA
jgi:hypothetical protein